MSEQAEIVDCWGCSIHAAVVRFSETTYAALARKFIFALQRIDASGIYGDAFSHKTLWDEYCHEVQIGPHDVLERMWEETIAPILDGIVEAIPREEAVLLTIGACWELDEGDYEVKGGVSPCPDLIRQNLERVVSGLACARDLWRFDPNCPRPQRRS